VYLARMKKNNYLKQADRIHLSARPVTVANSLQLAARNFSGLTNPNSKPSSTGDDIQRCKDKLRSG
jgi:hypothetical protein